jgi:hypothetical protein
MFYLLPPQGGKSQRIPPFAPHRRAAQNMAPPKTAECAALLPPYGLPRKTY